MAGFSSLRFRTLLAAGITSAALAALAIACSSGGGDDLPSTGDDGGLSDHSVQPQGDGGGGDGGEGGAVTPKQACETYLQAACTRYQECGQKLDCEHYLALCPDYLFAPGSSRGVSDVLACAVVRRNQDCSEIAAGIDPPCATAGTLKKGEPCDFSGQCESFSCSGFASCGTCAGITPPGNGCPKPGYSCAHNQICTSDDAGCVPKIAPAHLFAGDVCPQPDGGALGCPPDAPCLAGGALADAGTCRPRPNSGPCGFDLRAAQATACNVGTQCTRVDASSPQGTCADGAPQGDACGAAFGVTCATGLYCNDPNAGTCQPQAKLGDLCSKAAQCAPGAYCHFVSAGGGTCEAGPQVGGACGNITPDGGVTSNVICAQGICTQVTTDAGVKFLCTNKPAHELDSCSSPLSPCYPGLECAAADQECHLPACPIPDAGGD